MQLKDIAPSLLISVIMASPVYLLSYLPLSYYIILPIQIIVGAGLSIGLCEWMKKEEYIQIKHIVFNYVAKIAQRNKNTKNV